MAPFSMSPTIVCTSSTSQPRVWAMESVNYTLWADSQAAQSCYGSQDPVILASLSWEVKETPQANFVSISSKTIGRSYVSFSYLSPANVWIRMMLSHAPPAQLHLLTQTPQHLWKTCQRKPRR